MKLVATALFACFMLLPIATAGQTCVGSACYTSKSFDEGASSCDEKTGDGARVRQMSFTAGGVLEVASHNGCTKGTDSTGQTSHVSWFTFGAGVATPLGSIGPYVGWSSQTSETSETRTHHCDIYVWPLPEKQSCPADQAPPFVLLLMP